MKVQCEIERRSSPKQGDSSTSSNSDSSTTARVAGSFVSHQNLARMLRTACSASLMPEFKLSADFSERQRERSRFSPSLSFGRHFSPPLPTARPAAVMMLIEPRDGQWVIPLTVRPNHLPDHPGQVCLPGGRVEAGESICAAAEREFCEELGVVNFPGRTLGQLQSIYVYNSDFTMTPCVAIADRPQLYRPNPDEVAQLVYLPVADLLNRNRRVIKAHQRGSVTWTALGIEACGVHVWGATAIVLAELAAILSTSSYVSKTA